MNIASLKCSINFCLAHARISTKRMTELWNSRARATPEEILLDLAKECANLGVNACDVYGDFDQSPDTSYLRRFEKEISSTFGKEDALFLPSGVMAQQIALLIHYHNRTTAHSKSFVCHYSSHVLIHEKDTASWLLKMEPIIVPPNWSRVQEPISYEGVRAAVFPTVRRADHQLPAAVMVECPHREVGGKCTSYSDLEKISELCRENGIACHMDGARLWEALAHYTECTSSTGQKVTPIDLCNLFDSIYVSSYKGIGGLTGAILMGNASFIAEARVWLRRFGGNVFTLMPYAVSAYASYRKYVLWNAASDCEKDGHSGASYSVESAVLPVPYSMKARLHRLKVVVALLTTELSALSISLRTTTGSAAAPDSASCYVRFDPPVPQVCLIHVYIRSTVEKALAAHEISKAETGVACFARLRPAAPVKSPADGVAVPDECFFEFNMGIMNGVISDADWIRGWSAFVRALHNSA